MLLLAFACAFVPLPQDPGAGSVRPVHLRWLNIKGALEWRVPMDR
jgi:hypothetical protein